MLNRRHVHTLERVRKTLSDAGYVPLPEKFKERLLTSIDAIGATA